MRPKIWWGWCAVAAAIFAAVMLTGALASCSSSASKAQPAQPSQATSSVATPQGPAVPTVASSEAPSVQHPCQLLKASEMDQAVGLQGLALSVEGPVRFINTGTACAYAVAPGTTSSPFVWVGSDDAASSVYGRILAVAHGTPAPLEQSNAVALHASKGVWLRDNSGQMLGVIFRVVPASGGVVVVYLDCVKPLDENVVLNLAQIVANRLAQVTSG